MAVPTAGEANIRIVPDASEFLKKLKADLARYQAEFMVTVGADTKPAEEEIEKTRRKAKDDPVKTQLELDVQKAEDKLRALRIREESQKLGLKVEVDADTTRAKLQLDLLRIEAESRAITMRVDADTSAFDGLGDTLAQAFQAGFGGGFASPGVLTVGAGLLPALSSGLADVAAAVQTLAQAGLALPGILSAIGADMGTVKLATNGVGDAFKALDKASDGSAKNVKAANDALAKLAPSAADFVKQVYGLKPAFDSLQRNVQGNFFDGLGESVRTLANNDLPVLQKGLGDIATSMNENLKQLGTSLGSDSSKGLLDRILGNTGDAQGRLTAAIDPLVQGLGHLAAAGTDVLPRLSDDIAKVSEKFSNFITAADQSGALDKWINDGITGFEHLADTVGNIGSVIGSITGAVQGDLLKSLDDVTGKFAHWLDSPAGEQELKDFLTEGNKQLHLLGDTASNLGPSFKTGFHAAAENTHELLEVLDKVTRGIKYLQDNVPGLGDSFQQALNPLKPFIDVFHQLTADSPDQDAANKLRDALVHAGGGAPPGVPAVPVAPGATLPYQPPALTPAPPGVPRQGPGLPGFAPRNPLEVIAPGRANGGVLPGYSPGKDNMLVPLAGGEGIVRPEAVRKYGPGVIHMLNQGFDTGGVVPFGPNGGGLGAGEGLSRDPKGHIGWGVNAYDANKPTGGGNFNPNMRIDISTASVSPPEDTNSLLFGDILKSIPGAYGPKDRFPYHPQRRFQLDGGDGDSLWGPGFATGGVVDQWGNPINPGAAPGPIAPNPSQGGISGIAGSFLSGLGGPLGQLSGLIGGQGKSGNGLTPGFAGLAQAGNNPNLLNQWGQQTGDWLGNFGAKTLLSFGTTLYQGALGLVGLQNSILSPSNSWNQAGQKAAGFFLGQNGPLGYQGQSAGAAPAFDPNSTVHTGNSGQASVKGANASNVAIAQQAFVAAGFPLSQWGDFVKLENSEAGFNNTAKNPTSTAYGVGQFLDTTWAPYGAKTSDPTLQFQYMMSYIKQRYQTPAAAWKFHQANNWYDDGGLLPLGLSVANNQTGKPEAVLSPDETKAHIALAQAAVAAQKNPNGGAFQVPNANVKTPQPVVPTAPSSPAAQQPQDQQPAFTSPTPTGGASPSTTSHTLPAISKGVTSGFATAGSIAQTAAAIGSFGAAGAAGGIGAGLGGGGGGPSIQGLFQQFGKIANDVIDVGSAFLVGNVTPGTQPSQYGSLLRPAQNVPQTAPLDQGRTYVFNDTHSDRIVDQMRVKDSQDRQAALAQYGG